MIYSSISMFRFCSYLCHSSSPSSPPTCHVCRLTCLCEICPALVEFVLESNSLQPECAVPLAAMLKRFRKLVRISLRDNRLGGRFFRPLAQALAQSSVLAANLSFTALSARDLRELFSFLPVSNIACLNINYNNINDLAAKAIVSSLQRDATRLQALQMQACFTSVTAFTEFITALHTMKLQHIDVSRNPFHHSHFVPLCSALSATTSTVETLIMPAPPPIDNHLHEFSLQLTLQESLELYRAIINNPRLRLLDIRHHSLYFTVRHLMSTQAHCRVRVSGMRLESLNDAVALVL
eukprot:m.122728 g.122728  ORF g.122728 m.122728 type:complete len:294 (-) comp13741_c0_seq1:2370-3251(-)